MSYQKLSRDQIAERVAQDIPDGAYVNLGIGLPTKISKYLPTDKDVFLHSENGLLAFGPPPAKGEEDPELINAGKEYVTMLTGGSFFHHGDSFAMMRGGHLDIAVLGAFQVAANGDLANWHTGAPDAIPAVGGAMDLAVGAKKVFITTDHVTKQGEPKIVEELSYPVTGKHYYIFGAILVSIGVLVFTSELTRLANLEFLTNILINLNLQTSAGTSIASLNFINLGIAFFGGLASFLSPCVMPLIPAFLSYLGTISVKNEK